MGQQVSDGEFLQQLAAETGRRPSAIAARPGLREHELPFWDAFQTLHLSRANTGFGPGAIPLGEIVTYAELMQIPTGEEREQLVQIVRAMDAAYLEFVRKTHG